MALSKMGSKVLKIWLCSVVILGLSQIAQAQRHNGGVGGGYSIAATNINLQPTNGRFFGGNGSGYAFSNTSFLNVAVSGRFFGGDGSGYSFTTTQWPLAGMVRFGGGMGAGYATNTTQFNNVVLPVELKTFTARITSDAVLLEWSTHSEIDNDHFLIQKSHDGQTYQNIGQVAGHGTTNDPKNYAFTDTAPFIGPNYYRLKQVDYDGQYEYSPKSFVHYNLNHEISVYPNPVISGQAVSILHNGIDDFNLLIIGNNGKVSTIVESDLNTQHGKTSFLCKQPAGLYFLKIISGQWQKSFKMIIK